MRPHRTYRSGDSRHWDAQYAQQTADSARPSGRYGVCAAFGHLADNRHQCDRTSEACK